jgi:hypothetical protein
MMTIITPLVLGSIVTGGITLLSNPMLFRFLMSLQYPEARRDPPAGETDKTEIRLASEPYGQRSVPALRKVHLRRNGTAVQKVSERTPEYQLRRKQGSIDRACTTQARINHAGSRSGKGGVPDPTQAKHRSMRFASHR